jgi:hypothetical protein
MPNFGGLIGPIAITVKAGDDIRVRSAGTASFAQRRPDLGCNSQRIDICDGARHDVHADNVVAYPPGLDEEPAEGTSDIEKHSGRRTVPDQKSEDRTIHPALEVIEGRPCVFLPPRECLCVRNLAFQIVGLHAKIGPTCRAPAPRHGAAIFLNDPDQCLWLPLESARRAGYQFHVILPLACIISLPDLANTQK